MTEDQKEASYNEFSPVTVLLISANTETVNMPVLPLGLACVAAAAERAGMSVRTISLLGRTDIESALKNAIRDAQPDVIGVSVRNIDDQSMNNPHFMLDPVREMIRTCRSLCDAPVVLGGAGYSIFPEAVLSYTGADMGIRGEGESAFPELVRRLRPDTPGIPPGCFRRTPERICRCPPTFPQKTSGSPSRPGGDAPWTVFTAPPDPSRAALPASFP